METIYTGIYNPYPPRSLVILVYLIGGCRAINLVFIGGFTMFLCRFIFSALGALLFILETSLEHCPLPSTSVETCGS